MSPSDTRRVRAEQLVKYPVGWLVYRPDGDPLHVMRVELTDGRVLLHDHHGDEISCAPGDLLEVGHRATMCIMDDLKRAAEASEDPAVMELVEEAFEAGVNHLA